MMMFDQKLWKKRALERYQRAKKAGVDESIISSKLNRDNAYINALLTLIDWCLIRCIEVNFCRGEGLGIFYPENKCIKINNKLSPEKQVFFLLHECGHYLVGDKEKNERFGMGYSRVPKNDINELKTFHHRCDIVDEEFEAWFRGFKLAQRLGLKINKKRFDKIRVEMLKSYFKWALKIGGYGKYDDEEAMA